jgi:hypothetical protein
MGLLTDAGLIYETDKLARIYAEFALFASPSADPALFTGTLLQATANELLRYTVEDSDDFQIEADLNAAFKTVADSMNAASIMGGLFTSALTALNNHYASQSDEGGLAEYLLAVNNPTGALNEYNLLVDSYFQDFWTFVNGTEIDAESVMHPCIHPDWRGGLYPNAQAMGSRAVGGAFTDGYSCDASYGAVNIKVEVTTTFAGGGAPPTISVAGTDGEGNAITWTVNVTGGNNPVSAVATTITPAISTASARLTVAVGSVTGMVAGSILMVNSGLEDEETIEVESIVGTDITAVFLRNHPAGAALTGRTTFTATPSVLTSRLRDVTGITITASGHAAGAVRVIGVPERAII